MGRLDLPHVVEAKWHKAKEGSFAGCVRRGSAEGCRVALLGLADDLGVRLNKGRPGAASGPSAVRTALSFYGAGHDGAGGRSLDVGVYDAGDVEPAEGEDTAEVLAETHARVTGAARALHEAGMIVVGIGGGHDLTFPAARALAEYRGSAVGGVNLDAHADVRERAGSGMPFRALIEGGHLDAGRFTLAGASEFANQPEHVAYLRERGAEIVWRDDVGAGEDARAWVQRAVSGGAGFVSIDLDALDASLVMGVSAPNPAGLGMGVAMRLAREAGREAGVGHFDVMELSPVHDARNAISSVRAAALVLAFVAGAAERFG